MQINPFGFPLGAGMQSASAIGGTGLGFADALGIAIEGGAAPQLMPLKASPTLPAHVDPKLARTLLEQAQLAAPAIAKAAPGILPGLQQPTSLSELMATAAKLPGADPMPVAAKPIATNEQPLPVGVAVDAAPAAAPEIPAPAAPPLTIEPEIAPAAAPVVPAVEAAAPAAPAVARPAAKPETAAGVAAAPPASTVPPQAGAVPQPAGDALPDAPTTAAPAETAELAEPAGNAPSKPQKGPRATAVAAKTDPVPSNDAPPAIPAEMLAINPMPQPIVAQQPVPQQASLQQSAPRETANAPGGSVGSKVGKAAAQPASAQDAAQSAPGTGTADFGRAVAARAESAGSESNSDGQPQPEAILATAASTNAAAPILPQHAHNPNAVDTARVTAPAAPAAPAEPVVEARAGHLGHSLGVEIARKVELGEETLRIRLNPIELGRIEVTLAFDDKGSLQATVRTESAQAMDLLRQDTPDLARTLDQAGVRTDAQSFRFENRGGDGGGQQAQQQNPHSNRGQFASSDDDAGTAEPIYRPIRSDGQVDLLA